MPYEVDPAPGEIPGPIREAHHGACLGHVEPPAEKGQPVRPVEAFGVDDHPVRPPIAVPIRQGHHLAAGGHRYEEVPRGTHRHEARRAQS